MLKNPGNEAQSSIVSLIEKFGSINSTSQSFSLSNPAVPVSGKVIGVTELQYMIEACLEGWLTAGRFNSNFEKELSSFVGCKYVLTVNSGSSANLVALSSLASRELGERRIKPDDEIITVAAGFPTTINPIIQIGAVPVFVDINVGTYNIDVTKVENAITKKTKAIVLAHTLGNPFNLSVINKICKRYNLWLVEDCCDALGSQYEKQNVGTFGDIATLSFYPAHHITMGEGGAILTNNPQLKKIATSIRDWGRDCFCPPGEDNTCKRRFNCNFEKLGGNLPDGYDHKYVYSNLGYNLKITEMQAACGLAQLLSLEEFIKSRINNANILMEGLASLDNIFILPKAETYSNPSWFGFPLTIKRNAGFSRKSLIQYLEKSGISTRLLFSGNVTNQPYMSEENFKVVGTLINTDFVMNNTFWLGTWPGLKNEHLMYVINQLKSFTHRFNN